MSRTTPYVAPAQTIYLDDGEDGNPYFHVIVELDDDTYVTRRVTVVDRLADIPRLMRRIADRELAVTALAGPPEGCIWETDEDGVQSLAATWKTLHASNRPGVVRFVGFMGGRRVTLEPDNEDVGIAGMPDDF